MREITKMILATGLMFSYFVFAIWREKLWRLVIKH
jgi:hypothetical protein